MTDQERAMSILLRALMGRQYLAPQEWVIPISDGELQIAWVRDDGENMVCPIHWSNLTIPFEVGK
jgi:hypothetical protein